MGRWLLFADTPLQVYNSIKLRFGNIPKDDVVDLVVLDQFSAAREYVEKLRVLNGAFVSCKVIPNGFAASTSMDARKRLLKSYLGVRSNRFQSFLEPVDYTYFGFACPTYMTFEIYSCLREQNMNIRAVLYEDGTGSYNGNIFRRLAYLDALPEGAPANRKEVELLKRLLSLLPKSKTRYSLKEMFVNKPDLLRYKPPVNSSSMVKTKRASDLSNDVFGPCLPEPIKGSVVVLDVLRVGDETTMGADAIDQLVLAASSRAKKIYFRAHPRSTSVSKYYNLCEDYSGGLWELSCCQITHEDFVLIGMGSSAQLSPYLEAGLMPYLVFLHRMYFEEGSPDYVAREQTMLMASKTYGSNSERIFAPSSLDEAVALVRVLSN